MKRLLSMGAAASAGGAGRPSPDCYYCHVCQQSFEFNPGTQSDGRESEAPDICTACGAEAIELVRKGGNTDSLMPATDTLHQFVLASGGQVSGHELLMNMLAFSDHGIGFGADPADDAINQSFEAVEHTGTPTPQEIIAGLPERPLGIAVLEREPKCAVCGEDFVCGMVACALPCSHHFVSPWVPLHTAPMSPYISPLCSVSRMAFTTAVGVCLSAFGPMASPPASAPGLRDAVVGDAQQLSCVSL